MRTTIELPDHIMKKAKIKAVEEGISLKEFFIRSLEKELQGSGTPGPGAGKAPWKQLIGQGSAEGLSPEESGFEDYSGPDWHSDIRLNEPD
jgi:hypothetical protein